MKVCLSAYCTNTYDQLFLRAVTADASPRSQFEVRSLLGAASQPAVESVCLSAWASVKKFFVWKLEPLSSSCQVWVPDMIWPAKQTRPAFSTMKFFFCWFKQSESACCWQVTSMKCAKEDDAIFGFRFCWLSPSKTLETKTVLKPLRPSM